MCESLTNEYVINQLQSFLPNNDLLELRKVSKKIKATIDCSLASFHSSLEISWSLVNAEELERIRFLTSIYSGVRKLHFYRWSNLRKEGLRILSFNLRNVESIKIANCRLFSVNYYFGNIKDLHLFRLKATEDQISHIISRLKELESITLSFCKVSGDCFNAINGKVRKITWLTENCVLCERVTYNGYGRHIECFRYKETEDVRYVRCEPFVHLMEEKGNLVECVTNKMEGIQWLELMTKYSRNVLIDASTLSLLKKLNRLSVNFNFVAHCDKFPDTLSVTILEFSCTGIVNHAFALVFYKFLAKLSRLEKLFIHKCTTAVFSQELTAVVNQLKHMNSFAAIFREKAGYSVAKFYYHCNLRNVEKFIFGFRCSGDEDFYVKNRRKTLFRRSVFTQWFRGAINKSRQLTLILGEVKDNVNSIKSDRVSIEYVNTNFDVITRIYEILGIQM